MHLNCSKISNWAKDRFFVCIMRKRCKALSHCSAVVSPTPRIHDDMTCRVSVFGLPLGSPMSNDLDHSHSSVNTWRRHSV